MHDIWHCVARKTRNKGHSDERRDLYICFYTSNPSLMSHVGGFFFFFGWLGGGMHGACVCEEQQHNVNNRGGHASRLGSTYRPSA